jgi:homoserine kinase
MALSGAGPSVLIFLDANSDAERTRGMVAEYLRNKGLATELLLTSIA